MGWTPRWSFAEAVFTLSYPPSCRRTFEPGLGGSGWQGEDISGGRRTVGAAFLQAQVSFFFCLHLCSGDVQHAPGRGAAVEFYPC